MKHNMAKLLKKAGDILKTASVGSYTLAAILSVIADLIVKFVIPGGGLLEGILAVVAAIIVFAIVLLTPDEQTMLIPAQVA